MVWIAVPGEKALQSDHIRRVRRADQHSAGRSALKKSNAPKNERAHDALAEFGFSDQESA